METNKDKSQMTRTMIGVALATLLAVVPALAQPEKPTQSKATSGSVVEDRMDTVRPLKWDSRKGSFDVPGESPGGDGPGSGDMGTEATAATTAARDSRDESRAESGTQR
jgi:hypothetical protein